jgi:hypothetical protein
MSETKDVSEEWSSFMSAWNATQKEAETYQKSLSQLQGEEKKLSLSMKNCKDRIKKIYGRVKADKTLQKSPEREEKLRILRGIEDELHSNSVVSDRPAPLFLRLLAGNVDPVMKQRAQKKAYRENYEKFKLRFTYINFVVMVILFLTRSRSVDLFYQVFLIYAFATVLFRECVLKVNGSRIRKWWMLHHYLSLTWGVVFLTWPETESYERFRTPFYLFAGAMSLVQILQTNYQLSRLYPLRAVGKASLMDTVWGEYPIHFSQFGLVFLTPFIFSIHLYQFYNAWFLWSEARAFPNEWQLWALSGLFFIMAVGNVNTVLLILFDKFLKSRKRRSI